MMRKRFLVLFIACVLLLSVPALVNAENSLTPSQLIGTATEYLNEVRQLPAKIDEALCVGDQAMYKQGLDELATALSNAAATIEQMGMDLPAGLWNVYTTITSNPVCGIVSAATSAADLTREKWEIQAYHAGLYGKCGVYPQDRMTVEAAHHTFNLGNDPDVLAVIERWGAVDIVTDFTFTSACEFIPQTVDIAIGSGYLTIPWDDYENWM